MSLYGSQESAPQQQQNYFDAPPPQQTPNYYGAPPPQQPGQPQDIYGTAPPQQGPQPNYYGAPPAEPYQQPPNYYGAPLLQPPVRQPYSDSVGQPHAQQPPKSYGMPPLGVEQPPARQPYGNSPAHEPLPEPEADHGRQNAEPAEAPLQGLEEISPKVWCATTNPVPFVGAFYLCLGVVGFGMFVHGTVLLILGRYVEGGIIALIGIAAATYIRKIFSPELGAYSAVFDCNAKMVKITSSKIFLASCTTETQEVRFSDVRKVAFSFQEAVGGEANYFLLLTSGERVMFRSRVALCSQQTFGPEEYDKVVSRFAAIVNSAGFSVGTEAFVKERCQHRI